MMNDSLWWTLDVSVWYYYGTERNGTDADAVRSFMVEEPSLDECGGVASVTTRHSRGVCVLESK